MEFLVSAKIFFVYYAMKYYNEMLNDMEHDAMK